jgi:hypothetical protein
VLDQLSNTLIVSAAANPVGSKNIYSEERVDLVFSKWRVK